MKDPIQYTFTGETPERIDRVLHSALAGNDEYKALSRSQLQRWIAENRVFVDGTARSKPGWLVQPGSVLHIEPPLPVQTTLVSSGRKIDIIFQDDELLVINKPAGLSMHPGAGRAEDP